MIKKEVLKKKPTLNKKGDATRGSEDEMDQGRIMKYLKKTKADREEGLRRLLQTEINSPSVSPPACYTHTHTPFIFYLCEDLQAQY